MGLLTDDPNFAPTQGEGKKLVELFRSLDDDDRQKMREWIESGRPYTYVRDRLDAAGFPMGITTVRKGIAILKALGWES